VKLVGVKLSIMLCPFIKVRWLGKNQGKITKRSYIILHYVLEGSDGRGNQALLSIEGRFFGFLDPSTHTGFGMRCGWSIEIYY
jgi:hypothetical protein